MKWYRSRYVQFLEAEVARLQERERLLLNRIMPHLGYDPVDQPEKKPPREPKARRLSPLQWATKKMRDARKLPTEVVLENVPRPERKETDGHAVQSA